MGAIFRRSLVKTAAPTGWSLAITSALFTVLRTANTHVACSRVEHSVAGAVVAGEVEVPRRGWGGKLAASAPCSLLFGNPMKGTSMGPPGSGGQLFMGLARVGVTVALMVSPARGV